MDIQWLLGTTNQLQGVWSINTSSIGTNIFFEVECVEFWGSNTILGA